MEISAKRALLIESTLIFGGLLVSSSIFFEVRGTCNWVLPHEQVLLKLPTRGLLSWKYNGEAFGI